MMYKKTGRLARSPQLRPQCFSGIEAAACRCGYGQTAIDTYGPKERPGSRSLGYSIIVISLQEAANIVKKLKAVGASKDDEYNGMPLCDAINKCSCGIADAKLFTAAAIHPMEADNNR